MGKKNSETDTLGSSSSGARRVGGLLGTLIIVVLIVLVFGFLAIRTRTAAHWLESYLGDRLGVPVSIEKSSIAWPYDLVIEGLRTAEEYDGPDFSAVELRIRWTRRFQTSIELRRAMLVMRSTPEGEWLPAIFAALGPLQNIEEISAVTDSFEQKVVVSITDSSVKWEDEHERDLASATGIRFSMMPLQLPTRTIVHYHLYIRRADGGGGYMLRGVEREWLAGEDNTYMELMRRENQPGSQAAGAEGRDDGATDPPEGDAL
ncbi:MAG: hypothetical protein O2923_06235 [Verrucomicrobia bacterium]|nr:hypothetical protein [Verrucomicrobiota bacterium]MDA1087603.1 hypothetical protein [Verrucomicrobiota bacterium]